VGRVSIRQEVETVREALLWMQEDLKYRDSDAVGALDRIERKYQDADKNWLEMTNLAEGIEVERDRLRQEMEELRGALKHTRIDYDDARGRVFFLETEVERLRAEAARVRTCPSCGTRVGWDRQAESRG
jgi:hypothetical protein